MTASGSTTALPGTEPGAVKVTPFSEYPAKGRATGGVRCHRFLKGEDTLVFAWAGDAPARAAAASGAPIDLPEADRQARRLRHCRAAQPIAAAAGSGRRSASRGLCKADRMARSPRGCPALVLVAALALAGVRVQRRRDGARRRGRRPATPRRSSPRAKTTLDETSGVKISLDDRRRARAASPASSPRPASALHPSAFEGEFDLSVSGLPATAEVIAVDGTTYAKNSLLLPDWTEIDPADYGAPDPATLMEPDDGFSGLLAAITEVEEGDSVRGGEDNKEIFTEYTGTIPADAVEALIPTAEGDFDAVLHDQRRRRAARGRADRGASTATPSALTYTLTLDDYGTEKEITAP